MKFNKNSALEVSRTGVCLRLCPFIIVTSKRLFSKEALDLKISLHFLGVYVRASWTKRGDFRVGEKKTMCLKLTRM